MTDEREYLTEEEAARLWSRAAHLQAEAAHRLEAAVDGEGGSRAVAERDATGYSLTHVMAAASEAGISTEFLDAALADLRAERAMERNRIKRAWRASRAILGHPADAVSVRRVVRADVRGVLAAMEAVMPAEPYRLSLRDRHGDPANGGALVFDIEGASFSAAGSTGFVGAASWADFRQVVATATPRPGEPASTEVVLRAPVVWAMNLNAGFGVAFTGIGTGFGGFIGLAAASTLGALATGGAAPVLAAILCAGGAGAAGAGSLKVYRALYRYSLGRGGNGLNGLLSAVAAHAEGGWGFADPQPPKLTAAPEDER